ncbi:SDR family NAD(P)-dependent oxidoreductase [Bowmanella pacifica]|uniref:Sorbitol-6-phosphate 2-dehydrogenase n=1 Tax=Bowmanella pacifica TaxID=502051 RepID=A0A918DLG3_9ALTE|nr:SDR family oxidoreductase [Bowmanella pacifica]GGO70616.1 sorbitol-6-phosphate 2-dehydrogenase [Bowmanella pacifica]
MRLANKNIIVTGAAGGIGQAMVNKLLTEGANVLASDISDEALAVFGHYNSPRLVTLATDITHYAQVEAMISHLVSHFGHLDVLINNAGIATAKPLLEHDPAADFDPITRVNQQGVYYGILAAGRQFSAQGTGGVIVNTSSVYAKMASELTFSYNVSKAAVDMMTKCAALELAPLGVRVCAVAPGRVNTPMLHQYKEVGLWDHIRKEHMRETFTQPKEIANVVAFLASEEANSINGVTISAADGFENFKYPLLS